jgi:hypothetical protein
VFDLEKIKMNECKFCHGQKDKTIEYCKPMALCKTVSKTDIKDCQLILNEKENPILIVFDRLGSGAFLDISFCPMCGRKLI